MSFLIISYNFNLELPEIYMSIKSYNTEDTLSKTKLSRL